MSRITEESCSVESRDRLAVYYQNIRRMHLLERLAGAFNRAGIPLMVLKGGALNLTVYQNPGERPMCDLDLMVPPTTAVDDAMRLLEQCGCRRSQTLMREDFFPRYYYEAEFSSGELFPVVMDVHIRPFRTLRYSRFVPDDALWSRAVVQRIGGATVMLPCDEDMLLHLAVHGAIHGSLGGKWGEDIRRWLIKKGETLDWRLLIDTAKRFRLTLPLLQGLVWSLGLSHRYLLPGHVEYELASVRNNWRDRLALAQSPRDNDHPTSHVLVNVLTTPGLRYVLGYLICALFPSRTHMLEWYGREHTCWLPIAHLLRLSRPVWRVLSVLQLWKPPYEIIEQADGGSQVVARHAIQVGQKIGGYRVRTCSGESRHMVYFLRETGERIGFVMMGPLRHLGVDMRPNAQLNGYQVIARRRIMAGEPITIPPDRTVVTGINPTGPVAGHDKPVRKTNCRMKEVNCRRAA